VVVVLNGRKVDAGDGGSLRRWLGRRRWWWWASRGETVDVDDRDEREWGRSRVCHSLVRVTDVVRGGGRANQKVAVSELVWCPSTAATNGGARVGHLLSLLVDRPIDQG
jgi:hypothetical protein